MLLLLAEEGAAAAEQANPIAPNIGELFWGGLMFVLLYLTIRYVLLPPVTKVMDAREAQIKGDLAAAVAAQAQGQRLSHDLEDQLADVRKEAASIVDAARSEASAERAQLMSQAEREANALKEAAAAQIASERATALGSLKPELAKMSLGAASKVLDRNVDAGSAESVINSKLGSLS